jgi:hypothetical protein
MYVYGYRNLVEAQDLLFSLKFPHFTSGFNVSVRIRDVVRIREVPSKFLSA